MGLKHEHGCAGDKLVFDAPVIFSGRLTDDLSERLKRAPKEKGDLVIVCKRISIMVLPVKKAVAECHYRPPSAGSDEAVVYACPHSPEIDHGPEPEIGPEPWSDVLKIGKDVQVPGLISVIQEEGPVFEIVERLFEICGNFIGVARAGAQELKLQPVSVGETGLAIHPIDPVEIILSAAGRYEGSYRVFVPEVSLITEHSGRRWQRQRGRPGILASWKDEIGQIVPYEICAYGVCFFFSRQFDSPGRIAKSPRVNSIEGGPEEIDSLEEKGTFFLVEKSEWLVDVQLPGVCFHLGKIRIDRSIQSQVGRDPPLDGQSRIDIFRNRLKIAIRERISFVGSRSGYCGDDLDIFARFDPFESDDLHKLTLVRIVVPVDHDQTQTAAVGPLVPAGDVQSPDLRAIRSLKLKRRKRDGYLDCVPCIRD